MSCQQILAQEATASEIWWMRADGGRRFLVGGKFVCPKEGGGKLEHSLVKRNGLSYTIIATPTTTQKMQTFLSIWETEQKMLRYSKLSEKFQFPVLVSTTLVRKHIFDIFRWNVFHFTLIATIPMQITYKYNPFPFDQPQI